MENVLELPIYRFWNRYLNNCWSKINEWQCFEKVLLRLTRYKWSSWLEFWRLVTYHGWNQCCCCCCWGCWTLATWSTLKFKISTSFKPNSIIPKDLESSWSALSNCNKLEGLLGLVQWINDVVQLLIWQLPRNEFLQRRLTSKTKEGRQETCSEGWYNLSEGDKRVRQNSYFILEVPGSGTTAATRWETTRVLIDSVLICG